MSSVLKGTVVLTTIYESDILERYYENFRKYGHLENICVIVIPDRKTPQSVYNHCHNIARKGLKVICPSLSEQENFLAKLGVFSSLVPYNSDNRRNLGFLMALEQESDFLVSIDDDNFCLPEVDFIAEHSVVCQPSQSFKAVHSDTGWFNICDLLELNPPNLVYPRGFPYKQRHNDEKLSFAQESGFIRLNAGLWLSDPDLDGMTWLVVPVKAKALQGDSVVLGEKTWSPINTQNTALHREVIPSYYFIRMGYQMAGMSIDRYGDIFSGYFAQACLRHLGHRIRVGTPVAEHKRNSHNYLKDATQELACIWVLEDITQWLREVQLQGTTYSETYLCLSNAIEDAVEKFSGFIWTDTSKAYFHQMAHCMREWLTACQILSGGSTSRIKRISEVVPELEKV